MKAWLVVNAFLQQKKFEEIHQWLQKAGEKQGICFEVKTNAELLASVLQNRLALLEQVELVDFVLFWDKDVVLAKQLEALGYRLYNSSFGIESCDNKALTHLYLGKENIPMPDTVIAPMTYGNIGYTQTEFLDGIEKRLGYPMVVKESYGSFGQQVYLCEHRQELLRKVKELEGKSFIFQKFIAASKGTDVRLQVVGDKVVAAMERTAKEGDFRANITNGGSMKAYEHSKEEQELAIRCCEILKVDFAGVDLMFDEQGKPIVCEVNSNAHFKNIFDCTGINTAEYIIAYLKKKVEML